MCLIFVKLYLTQIKSMKCLIFLFMIAIFSCQKPQNPKEIMRCQEKITIDGKANEEAWTNVEWQDMNHNYIGEPVDSSDFKGRFKLLWDPQYIYILAETHDDTLIDIHPDGLDRYWDDDCLEIFIDEDNSKGNHQYNHNAFAYHIALNGRITDIGPDSVPNYYSHLKTSRITDNKKTVWELAMPLYKDTYKENKPNKPAILSNGKKIGFMIAYCDNDFSAERESFIGSEYIMGEDKNRGWIDAGVFGDYKLTNSGD